MKRRKISLIVLLVGILVCSTTLTSTNVKADIEPIAYLVLKTNGGGLRPDYCLFIADYLEEIGIDVEVYIEEWVVFIGTLLVTHDFDLAVVGMGGGGLSPDLSNVYSESGDMNMFGIHTIMPYGQENENMLTEGLEILDFPDRREHYNLWQQLLMDQIVPILPLFSPQHFAGVWSNTGGFDYRWGIPDSLPYMYYDGLHTNQDNLNEFNYADDLLIWPDLNPLTSIVDDPISSLIEESIVQWNPDCVPSKNGIVEDWEILNSHTYKFYIRENIFWNPSYDTTGRTDSSTPLDEITTGELVIGLKSGEYSNGMNQLVTAKDAVFSLLAYANPIISDDATSFNWLRNVYLDSSDPLVFYLSVDGDLETTEFEITTDFWPYLSFPILPEFFLNSTDPNITYTNGGAKCVGLYPGMLFTSQWLEFRESAFSCGKYMLDYYTSGSLAVLRKNPNWYGVGAIDGTVQNLGIETVNVHDIQTPIDQLLSFQSGALDYIHLSSLTDARRDMEHDSSYTIHSKPDDYLIFLGFNLGRPHITRSIRKAICYAINREMINEMLHNSDHLISHSPIYPYTAYYYYDDIIKYDYDLEQAFEWLDISTSIPKYSIKVENVENLSEDIIFQIDCTSGPNITGAMLSYKVNQGDWEEEIMIEEKNNLFTFNLGSNLMEDDLIKFFFTLENNDEVEFETSFYTAIIGEEFEPIKAGSFLETLFMVFSLILACAFIGLKRRKNQN